jgi:hypothetical protein
VKYFTPNGRTSREGRRKAKNGEADNRGGSAEVKKGGGRRARHLSLALRMRECDVPKRDVTLARYEYTLLAPALSPVSHHVTNNWHGRGARSYRVHPVRRGR